MSAQPLRVIQVGAGAMGRAWLRTIAENADVELVALVDLNTAAAEQAAADHGIANTLITDSLEEAIERTSPDAVVDVTVPVAHSAVNITALRAGLPVLCEKPIAPTVADAREQARVAKQTGRLLMTSQSRRYYRALTRFREQIRTLGPIGAVSTRFFKAPHFGGFREEMRHVLLVDMAIHAFDAVRYLTGRDPVSVFCVESNPPWSWFAHGGNAVVVFEFADGSTYTYDGSWCAPGEETTWNGSWFVSGQHGTATWDGEGEPELTGPTEPAPVSGAEGEEIAGALADFVDAVRTGRTPDTEVHANIVSLAMVEAAVLSAEQGRRVLLAEVLDA
ncbi:Gfo/Idh/MocA family protein [Microbacterium sp. ZW T5_56]|uniref:Gfo/Idh/MocA family protein n=1 Tax=Microbacterium sp. ZW T5_56 TaxID=3378081 RepID=UPI003851E2A4